MKVHAKRLERGALLDVQAEAAACSGCVGCTVQSPAAASTEPGNTRSPASGPSARLQAGDSGDCLSAGYPTEELGACRLPGAGAVGAVACKCTSHGDGTRAAPSPASKGRSATVGAGVAGLAETSTAGDPSSLSCTFSGEVASLLLVMASPEASASPSGLGEALHEEAPLSELMLAGQAEFARQLPSEAVSNRLPRRPAWSVPALVPLSSSPRASSASKKGFTRRHGSWIMVGLPPPAPPRAFAGCGAHSWFRGLKSPVRVAEPRCTPICAARLR
mmetsp:Transcript_39030/g.111380  ORF Transcript_39030/g.111380 Transcript_39030/m.111380 type:complete len:275 (-) Transcript_39030:57-881(-)